jgi:5-methylcytosine-specific restriction endonuclease McrA
MGQSHETDRWGTFKLVMPREYYNELMATLELAIRCGASNKIEAIRYMCAEFRATWEAIEMERPIHSELDVARIEAFDRDNWRCLLCESPRNLTVHHITPLSQGGARLDTGNLATLCWYCHEQLTVGGDQENWKAMRPQLLAAIEGD